MRITTKNLQKKIPVNPKRIKQAIRKVLSREGVKKPGEITICFVSDKLIKELNAKFHKRNYPTDVLAFDLREKKDRGRIFADIIISTDTAIRNAKIFKTTPGYEIELYAIHAVLHLIGYDDHSRRQIRIMHRKESKYADT